MNYAKFSNIYKDGKVISKKDKWGRNRAYTTEEVEQLIDELAENKDENGKVKDPQALNNANEILFQMYQKYGNPHEKEILEVIKKMQEEKSLEEQKKDALDEVNEVLDGKIISENKHLVDVPGEDEPIVVGNGILDQIVTEEEKNVQKLDSDHNDEYVEFEEVKDERTAA